MLLIGPLMLVVGVIVHSIASGINKGYNPQGFWSLGLIFVSEVAAGLLIVVGALLMLYNLVEGILTL